MNGSMDARSNSATPAPRQRQDRHPTPSGQTGAGTIGNHGSQLGGTDQNGLKGFENRLNEKLGNRLDPKRIRRGYSLYNPGDPTEGFTEKATR